MNIAIIDDSQSEAYGIKKILNGHNWLIDYYKSSKDFGNSDLNNYDVVITPFLSILKSICNKATVQLILIGSNDSLADAKSDVGISGIVDRNHPEKLKRHLEFVENKLIINNAVKVDTKQLNRVAEKLSVINGGR